MLRLLQRLQGRRAAPTKPTARSSGARILPRISGNAQVGTVIDVQKRMAQAIQGILLPVTAAGWCRCWEPEGHNRWHSASAKATAD